MQWFVVKYRKPDGTMTEAEFEAADKSALFKLLAEKKISARHGGNGDAGKKIFRSLQFPTARALPHPRARFRTGSVVSGICRCSAISYLADRAIVKHCLQRQLYHRHADVRAFEKDILLGNLAKR